MKQKITKLSEDYQMSQMEVAEKMFLNSKTIMAIEKRALDKLRKLMQERGLTSQDLLED